MNQFKLFILLVISSFMITTATGQQLTTNASLGVLTGNSGQVGLGSVVDIIVTIANTGSNPILANRVRPQISIPATIALPLPTAQQTGLPAGWIVVTNTASGVITICNGTDVIPAGATRTALIKVQGNSLGGPSTVSGVLQFGPGTAVCTGLGTLTGDAPGDNTSTSTIAVTNTAPLSLLAFNASLVNCIPMLNWITEFEINTDFFEIERSNFANSNWESIGRVLANGNSNTRIDYTFTDNNFTFVSGKVYYRLKMMDRDGSFKYSKILSVLTNCKTTTLSAYPNPVKDGKLYLNVSGIGGKADAALISPSGQIMMKTLVINGSNAINVNGYANGNYTLQIRDSNGLHKNVKVVIAK